MLAELELSGLIVVCLLAVCAVAPGSRCWSTSAGWWPRPAACRWRSSATTSAGPTGSAATRATSCSWYRTLSLSLGRCCGCRAATLAVVASRPWDPQRDMALRPNLTIAECEFRDGEISLGFPDDGLTGFLSWLEARAPLRSLRSVGPRRVSGIAAQPASPAGLPQHVPAGVGAPGQDEQQVRQPVEVGGGQRVGVLGVGLDQRPGAALGAPGHRAGHVQQRRTRGATGQHEAGQRRQLALNWSHQPSSRARTPR